MILNRPGKAFQRSKESSILLAGITGVSSLLLLLALPRLSPAQTTFSAITGTVTDPSGAVIPGARVTATNENTGLVRSGPTTGSGTYSVVDVPPGSYRVRVEASGFASQEKPGVVVYADRAVNLDFQLTLGAATTLMEVQGAAPVIDTETGTTAYTKTTEELLNLPLTVRQENSNISFAMYNPGVGVNDSGNFFASGVRQVDTYMTNDGIVEMQDPDGSGGTFIAPDIESVAEINYNLADSPAEFHSPVNFTTVTKSGTNRLHGSLYYDYNGNALNARDFFASTVPFVVSNNFAASVSGPIKRNKTFYFGDYEGLRAHAASIVTANAPLAAWHTGDFSGLLSSGTQLTNPFTGQPITNNQIPSTLLNPVSLKLQSYFYPLPNFGPADLQSGNWRGLFPSYADFDIFDARVDHIFNERNSVFGRFNSHRRPALAYNNRLPPVGPEPELRTDNDAAFSYTHTFSPTLLNEFRAGYSRDVSHAHTNLIGSDIISQAGIQGITTTGIPGVPTLSISGITSTSITSSHDKALTDYELTNNLSWTHGAHSIKFGADVVRDEINNNYLPKSIYGSYTFNGTFTGLAYADFLLGLPQSTGINLPAPSLYLRGTMWSFYAQDQFKVTPRLTLTYGLRYELQGPYYDKFGRISGYDPTLGAVVVPDNGLRYINPLFPSTVSIVSASKAGYPAGSMIDFRKDNLYPRIGIAYKLTGDGKTVIRAGYGSYGNIIYGALGRSYSTTPFSGAESFYNSITNGIPLFSFPDPFVAQAGLVAPFENVGGINPHIKTPYTQQWNVTLERQFGTVGVSLAYIGSHSVNLIYPRNIDQPPPSTTPFSISELPNPNFSTITWNENGSNEEYNALQIAATKTVGHKLTFSAGWTWARDLTDQLDEDWAYGQEIQNQFDRDAEWGNNSFTPTQRFYADAVYALPVGRGHRFMSQMPRLGEDFLGGWRLSAVVTLQTGQWYNPTFDSPDPSNTNNFGGRPDAVPSVSTVPPGGRNINNWFNVSAFKIPGCPDNDPFCSNPANIGRFGNAGNDTLATPSMRNLDLGLMKDFRVGEHKTLTFQAIFSDVLNHPNFGYPAADISSPDTAAAITSSLGNFLAGSSTSRVVNFALRFEF